MLIRAIRTEDKLIMSDEVIIEPVVGIKCPQGCGREFKNQGGVNLHLKSHRPKEVKLVAKAIQVPDPVAPITEGDETQPLVVFYSPRSVGLTVVVIPERWVMLQTPAGLIPAPSEGKSAEFNQGKYTTDDPEIIACLEGDLKALRALGSSAKPYLDHRFPILSDRQMKAMASK